MTRFVSIKSAFAVSLLITNVGLAQSFELQNGDTVNYIDASGLKQKHWLIKNDVKKLHSYAPDQLVEEGDYLNNNKTGLWVMYYPNDKVKHELTFKSNRAYGPAKFYYKNGKVSEEGFWKFTKWDGSYKTFYENGKPQYEWNYKNGRKDGNQVWYHENGKKMYEGNYMGGREDGKQMEWDENGNVVAERIFANGKMDTAATKFYKPPPKAPEPVVKVDEEPEDHPDVPQGGTSSSGKGHNYKGIFTGNGYHDLYSNTTKQLIKSGLFKKGKLIDGWVFIYADDLADKCETKKELKNRRVIKEKDCGPKDGDRK